MVCLNVCAYYVYIYIYTYIYVYIWLLIKIPLSRNGHSSRIKCLLSRNFRDLHVYLSQGPCWPTTPLMKIRSPPVKLRQRITDHFLVAFLNMQLASRNPFSGQFFFLQSLLAHPLEHALWLSPALSHNFRENIPIHRPRLSAGGALKEKRRPNLGAWLSQSLTFGNLATATRILWCPSPAGPRAAVGGSPLHIMIIIPNFREIKFYFRELEKKLSRGFPT